jgi:general secretion pathway protein D
VAVQSGQTVLLGGLIKQTDAKGSSGAPGLSRIPILGGIFGSQNRRSDRQELLVLITPTVIASGDDAEALTDEYRRRFIGLEPLRGGK